MIGTQKGGTTTLFHGLARHPRVVPPTDKEIHYFDWNHHRGDGWYRAHFPVARPGVLTGEASPSYLVHPHAPARAVALVPDARLVVLLREPVARAYSAYHMLVRRGRETRSFAEVVADQIPALESMDLARPSERSFELLRRAYLLRSMYVRQIERWLAHYPRERLLVLQSERLFADSRDTYERLTAFLGLEPWAPDQVEVRNVGGYRDELDPGLRRELEEFFRPHNERLFALLDLRFDW